MYTKKTYLSSGMKRDEMQPKNQAGNLNHGQRKKYQIMSNYIFQYIERSF